MVGHTIDYFLLAWFTFGAMFDVFMHLVVSSFAFVILNFNVFFTYINCIFFIINIICRILSKKKHSVGGINVIVNAR